MNGNRVILMVVSIVYVMLWAIVLCLPKLFVVEEESGAVCAKQCFSIAQGGKGRLSVMPAANPLPAVSVHGTPGSAPVPERHVVSGGEIISVSSARVRSYGNGLVVPMQTPSLPQRRNHVEPSYNGKYNAHIEAGKNARTVLALGYTTAAEYITNGETRPVQHRAPGTIGGDSQGDTTGESVWSQWLDEYWGTGATDISGLEAWWNGKYGSGYTPDIFEDFREWATPTPLGDGELSIILMALLYIMLKYRDVTAAV